MQITKEQLDLFIRLQPFFKSKGLEENAVVELEGLIIPSPLDLTCSSRCLWGMIDGYFVSIFKSEKGYSCNVHKKETGILRVFEADNPVTAMLLALIEQEDIK